MNKKKHMKRIISYILILIVTTIFSVLAFSDLKSENVQAIEIQNNNNNSVQNTPIMGTGSLSREKMLQILYDNNEDKDLSYLGEFLDFTIEEATVEGVNYDIVFSLMMVETGYLNFNGEVYDYQNNFGGLGATGSPDAKGTDTKGRPTNGVSFTNVREGIRAVVQHLKAYASIDNLNQTCVDTRFKYVKRGCIIYVEYLGIKENPDGYGWAAGEGYGTKIKNLVANTSAQKVVLSQISSVNVTGLCRVGKPIKIEVSATPSENSLYRIWIKDNGGWKIVSDYSTNAQASYTPTNDGAYAVEVDVKNKFSNKNYDDVWSKTINIVKPELVKISNASVTGIMKIGNPITIAATVTPSEDALYRIWIKDNGNWKIISDYSTNSKVSYTPTHDGEYAVQIEAKNKYSTNKYDSVWSKILSIAKYDLVKITNASVTGVMEINKPITIEVTATPSEEALYRIWIKDNGDWKIISDYSANSKVIYTPTHDGQYSVQVDVKGKLSNNKYDSVWSKLINIVDPNASKLLSAEMIGDMKAGTPITIKATASPASDTLYRIWIRDNGNWKIISDYSSCNKINYIPNHKGTYVVEIDVKNKSSSKNYEDVYSKIFTVTGVKEAEIDNVEVSGMINLGKKMTINAKAKDNEGTLYRIWIKENGNWNLISDYSTNSVVSYIPKFKGPYAVQVDVKNQYSNNNYDDVWSQFVYTKPKDITIVLDAGHGLSNGKYDVGAIATHYGVNYIEEELNLNIAQKAYNELVKKGYNVIMTRSSGSKDVDFIDRPKYANNNVADLYISIHQNSFTTPIPCGVEVLYTSNSMDEKERQAVISTGIQDPTITHSSKVAESENFATILEKSLVASTGFKSRGVKDQNLLIGRNTYMPSVLIECGFISNPDEANKLTQDGYQETISKVIEISVNQYFK